MMWIVITADLTYDCMVSLKTIKTIILNKKTVQDICQGVVPETKVGMVLSAMDVIHRIGSPQQRDGKTKALPRPVIIRFQTRTVRDALWKGSKNSSYLKNNKLIFKEDLTAADKENRGKLWPAVEEARKASHKEYFVGNRAFVEEKEIKI
ncbi:hypothetical protein GOODEAATRI_016535 [Goodea atripinnis]|uniref:Uncharacterized protein n=1 Tax=Goodea atripinnis TaxID=208336 RepID=A0ABV0N203_9TELE